MQLYYMSHKQPLCTDGVSTNGVAASFILFLTEGPFWVLLLAFLFAFPKVPGRTFLHNLSTFVTFAAAPLVLTPFVSNRFASAGGLGTTERQ